ncbi:MAG: CvpA family protein [Chloroflexota bacterium]|nr:CvpA family protein [Chloroflexota bacterium]
MDAVIVIVALFSGFIGLSQGIFGTLFATIGLLLGVNQAGIFYKSLAEDISPSPHWPEIVAFSIILGGMLLAATLIGHGIRSLLHLEVYGIPARLGGGLIGIFVGLFFSAAVFCLILNISYDAMDDDISNSTLAEALIYDFPLMLQLLPGEFDSVNTFFEETPSETTV